MRRGAPIASGRRRQLTAEQRAAVDEIRALARPYRFRVQIDVEGWPTIPGRYGQIEWFDGENLAVYTARSRLFAKLWAMPGMRRHQTGDVEMRALFPPETLEQVASVIRARRRRTQVAPSSLGNLRSRSISDASEAISDDGPSDDMGVVDVALRSDRESTDERG